MEERFKTQGEDGNNLPDNIRNVTGRKRKRDGMMFGEEGVEAILK